MLKVKICAKFNTTPPLLTQCVACFQKVASCILAQDLEIKITYSSVWSIQTALSVILILQNQIHGTKKFEENMTQENNTPDHLSTLRGQIDSVDRDIHDLLNRRAEIALQVAKTKLEHEDSPQFYRPEREAQVLRAIMARNTGPIENEKVAKLFREIMSICLSMEEPQQIAYLGPEGTFTHAAALKHFGQAASTRPLPTIPDVFREVESGTAAFGVVPVENSSEGVVNHTLDSFLASDLYIIGEVELRIHQHFLVAEHTRLDSLSKIYSHQQSLAQCRRWLDTNYPNVERVAVSSNAEAARRIKTEWHSAAVAGGSAANAYGLVKKHENIEDNPNNTTRFLIIGKNQVPASGNDKTSVIIAAHDRAGALLDILKPFADNGVSLTSIETRPSKPDKWAYVFFIDMVGHADEPAIKDAIAQIRPNVKDVRVLGGYPRAVL